MKGIAIITALVAIVFCAAAWFIRLLARRVVGVVPRRKTLTVRRVGDDLEMPQSVLTLAPGNYGLWFGDQFEHHALIGSVVSSDDHHVVRRVLKTTAPMGTVPFEAQWTGHVMAGPAEISPDLEDVTVPLRNGISAPAWLFRSDAPDSPWVIHVQGIRTSRLVTLRSVAVAQSAGMTSLVITYTGSGDGPSASTSALGLLEWSDVADAITYARTHGAPAVYVVAWSMGAGIALELLRQEPGVFDRLALIAPATNWRPIIRLGVRRAGLPGFVGSVVTWSLGSRLAAPLIGMPGPLSIDRLDWCRGLQLNVPTLVVHSSGDDEIPFELTKRFVAAHANATLVETSPAPHGWEANVDPETFRGALVSWLDSPTEVEAR